MKKMLLLSIVMVCCASLAFAQGGSIGAYADAGGVDCNIVTPAAPNSVMSLYMIHNNASAKASEWSLPVPACFTGIFLNDVDVVGIPLGNSNTGVSIGYGVCLNAPAHILTVNWLTFVGAGQAPCCEVTVLPHPQNANNRIEGADCQDQLTLPTGETSTINGNDADCPCTVPTEETTWGGIKAIYE